jgi:hypothetical protein
LKDTTSASLYNFKFSRYHMGDVGFVGELGFRLDLRNFNMDIL